MGQQYSICNAEIFDSHNCVRMGFPNSACLPAWVCVRDDTRDCGGVGAVADIWMTPG